MTTETKRTNQHSERCNVSLSSSLLLPTQLMWINVTQAPIEVFNLGLRHILTIYIMSSIF